MSAGCSTDDHVPKELRTYINLTRNESQMQQWYQSSLLQHYVPTVTSISLLKVPTMASVPIVATVGSNNDIGSYCFSSVPTLLLIVATLCSNSDSRSYMFA
jgi:hypothetical protein